MVYNRGVDFQACRARAGVSAGNLPLPPPLASSLLLSLHGSLGSNKSPAITGADLLFISNRLRTTSERRGEQQEVGGGVRGLSLGLKVDLTSPAGTVLFK